MITSKAVAVLVLITQAININASSIKAYSDETEDDTVPESTDNELVEIPLKHHNGTHRISAGYDAAPGQFPSFVQVHFKNGFFDTYFTTCGGTLLDDRHILTAAHCSTQGRIAEVFTNPFGPMHQWTSYPSERICSSKKFKTGYAPFMQYDVAIVKLRQPVHFSNLVQPACLPNSDLGIGVAAFAVGLGHNYEGTFGSGSSPSIAQVLPISRVQCAYYPLPHERDYCFRYRDPSHVGSICSGDSGGPIYTLGHGCQTVHGIASSSEIGCRPGFGSQSVFGSTYRLRKNIDDLIRICS